MTEYVKMPALIAKPKPLLLATDREKIPPEFVKSSYGFAIVLEIVLPWPPFRGAPAHCQRV